MARDRAGDRGHHELSDGIRRVVVFGGAGFLGSFVADALSDAGHDVVIFDRQPSRHLRADQREIVGDILDVRLVREAIEGASAVYNYAAIADIAAANADPVETVRVNVQGNATLLDAARHADVRRFVFASTLYVNSEMGGFYRTSKQAAELLVEDYQRHSACRSPSFATVRCTGPRATDSNWIYSALRQALTEGRIVRHGDGEEVREYIHVWDAAQSSVDILAPEFENARIVITGDQAVKVRDLLMMIREMLGNQVAIDVPAARRG